MKITILAAVIGLSFALTACSKAPQENTATEPSAAESQAAVKDYPVEDTQPLDAAPVEDENSSVIEPAASEPQPE